MKNFAIITAGIIAILSVAGIISNILTTVNIARDGIPSYVKYALFAQEYPEHPVYPSVSVCMAIGIPFYIKGQRSFGDAPNLGDTIGISGFTFFGHIIFESHFEPQ